MRIDDSKNKGRLDSAPRTSAMTSTEPAQSAADRMRFVRKLVDLANGNDEEMDGTMEPVRRIVVEADVVFAVWPDAEEESGVGCLLVKGAKLLKKRLASQTTPQVVTTVECICAEQAIALKQQLGDRDDDA
jgi:hypothetical protein